MLFKLTRYRRLQVPSAWLTADWEVISRCEIWPAENQQTDFYITDSHINVDDLKCFIKKKTVQRIYIFDN